MATPERYIRAIRNQHKRDYAQRYLAYLRGELRNEPQGSAAGISAMAAQAVRLQLGELVA